MAYDSSQLLGMELRQVQRETQAKIKVRNDRSPAGVNSNNCLKEKMLGSKTAAFSPFKLLLKSSSCQKSGLTHLYCRKQYLFKISSAGPCSVCLHFLPKKCVTQGMKSSSLPLKGKKVKHCQLLICTKQHESNLLLPPFTAERHVLTYECVQKTCVVCLVWLKLFMLLTPLLIKPTLDAYTKRWFWRGRGGSRWN